MVAFAISVPETPPKMKFRRFAVRDVLTGDLYSDLYYSVASARAKATHLMRYGWPDERKNKYEIAEFECVEVQTHIHAPRSLE